MPITPARADLYAPATAARSGFVRPKAAVAMMLAVALFIAAYYSTFLKLIGYWVANDIYSYAFLVPIISAIVIYADRDELKHVGVSPSVALGGFVSIGGLALLLVGRFSSTNVLEELSLIVTIYGLTLLVFGRAVCRIVAFPLLYLLAMVPIWEYFTARLHPPFQSYSAALGVGALKALGIPVLREGVLIELPNVTLEVAQACSGINYLVAVLSIGIPLTYLLVRGWSKRVLIVCLAAAIALLSNGARVAMVSLFAYYGMRAANGDIHGPFALFRSLLVSGIGFVALFALVFRLADKDRARPLRAAQGDVRRWLAVPDPGAVAVAIVMLAVCVGFERLHKVEPVATKRDLRGLPSTIGSWEMRRLESAYRSVIDLDGLPFDEKLSREYASADGTTLNLFVGYLRRQEQAKELAGYEIRTVLSGREHSSYEAPSRGARLNDLLTNVGVEPFYVSYCYVLNGRVVSDDYRAKLYTAWDSLVHGRSNGAIVVVKAKVRNQESLDSARGRVGEFLQAFLTVSNDYLPTY